MPSVMTLSVISILKYKAEYLTSKPNVGWSGSFWESRPASCLTSRGLDICGANSPMAWSTAVVALSSSWIKFVFAPLLLFLSTKPSRWKLNYVEMLLFRPERAACVYGWLVKDCRACSHQSLCCLIRAEHPETASNDKGIGIKSQRYLESNWSGWKNWLFPEQPTSFLELQ